MIKKEAIEMQNKNNVAGVMNMMCTNGEARGMMCCFCYAQMNRC